MEVKKLAKKTTKKPKAKAKLSAKKPVKEKAKTTPESKKEIKKEEVVDILSKTLDHKTRRMVTNLLFAKQHENKDNIQSSFDTLSQWKKSRLYK